MSYTFPFPQLRIIKNSTLRKEKKMETKQLDEQQCAPQDIQVQANQFTSRVHCNQNMWMQFKEILNEQNKWYLKECIKPNPAHDLPI